MYLFLYFRLCNILQISCFPNTYDLQQFKNHVKRFPLFRDICTFIVLSPRKILLIFFYSQYPLKCQWYCSCLRWNDFLKRWNWLCGLKKFPLFIENCRILIHLPIFLFLFVFSFVWTYTEFHVHRVFPHNNKNDSNFRLIIFLASSCDFHHRS